MKANKYIKLTKVAESAAAKVKAGDWNTYKVGDILNQESLPVEYTLEGILLKDIKIGESVSIDRRVRNGVKINGDFESSPVVKILPNGFETLNSVYLIEDAIPSV